LTGPGATVSTDHDEEQVDEEALNILEVLYSDLLQVGSIAIIKSHEELTLYKYLLHVLKVPFVLDKETVDAYGNSFPAGCEVVVGHYYEKFPKSDFLYFIDEKKEAHILTCCLVPVPTVCPNLIEIGNRRKGRAMLPCYKVTPNIHEELFSYL